MATPGKASKKEKKKPVPVKTSLNNPYTVKWEPLEKGHARIVLKTLTEKFGSVDLRKRHVKVFRKWRSKRKEGKTEHSRSADTAESTQKSQEKSPSDSIHTNESTQKRECSDSGDTTESIQKSHERGWTHKELRNELAIGINEVTKGLEKNELGLVLVCDSVKPAHMTSHLIPLSHTRSVPACQVPGLSASLAESLGLTSVLALGFKRHSSAFADTIAAIVPKVPPVGVAWLPTGTGVSGPVVVQVPGETEQQLGDAEEPVRGRKRKLEDFPEAQKDHVTLLQPLKVKKVIPNPAKIRKTKTKVNK